MSDFMVWDADDFGCNHVISGACQSHDCRDKLDEFHYANPNFKATLFAIPGEMTAELMNWCKSNQNWIELAVHGWYHTDNYECKDITYEEMERQYNFFKPMLDFGFVKGFKAPGWQISDDAYKWLLDKGWWVADQGYNDERRPQELNAYINYSGNFMASTTDSNVFQEVIGKHYHTWDVGSVGSEPNGVYEAYGEIKEYLPTVESFKFVSEVLND